MTGQCKVCGGWIPPVDREYLDEGTYHSWCLSHEEFEAACAKYECKGGHVLHPGEYDSDDLDRLVR